ncbi:MAG: winged helix-turn-helix domain-containing protein [Dehalococcoidia bacterium]
MTGPQAPAFADRAPVAFDDFELDFAGFELRRSGEPVPMEPQAFEVLAFLVENPGRVMTKDEILDRVWPDRYVSEASLNSRVMTARKALGDSGSEQRYIKTVHGRGYRFIGATTEAPASPPPEPVLLRNPVTVLPAITPMTSFVGRQDELARIQALSSQSACRLLTIAGHGGIGKTRLLQQFIAATQSDDEEFVLFQLEHAVDEGCAPSALAAGLGVTPSGEDTIERVVEFLADKRLTIVLDNLEPVLDAARPVVETILRGTTGIRFLVTSRVTLGIQQEWVLRLGGLGLEPLAPAEVSEAAALFLSRAEQAGLYDQDKDMEAIDGICRLVDGLPLAIELAASLARFLPCQRIRELIEQDASATLTWRRTDLPARHRSIEALFEESLRLLSDDVRRVLTELAAFEGDFDAAAAQAIAGANIAALGALVDASVLSPRDGRFGLHPLLSQLLRAQGAGVSEAARVAHAEYYADFLDGLTGAIQGPGQFAAVAALEAEVAEVVAAWRWAVEHSRIDLIEKSRRSLFSYLMFRGMFKMADDLAEAALAIVGDEHPETRSALLVMHAWILFRVGKTTAAAQSVQQSLAISRAAELSWKPGFGSDGRIATAVIFLGLGNYDAAFAAATQSIALAEAAGDPAGAAFACWMAGVARLRFADAEFDDDAKAHELRRERLREASGYIERAGSILEQWEESWLLGFVEIERGLIAQGNDDRERACGHFRRSYRLRRRFHDPQGMSSALIYLADNLVELGQAEEANELYPEIRALVTRSGDATGMAELLRSQGITATARRDLSLARRSLVDSLNLSRSLNFVNNTIGALRALGEMFDVEGDTELAARIMALIAAHPSATPGSRAKSRAWLLEHDQPAIPPSVAIAELDSLTDEAARAATPLNEWLQAGDEPGITVARVEPWYLARAAAR